VSALARGRSIVRPYLQYQAAEPQRIALFRMTDWLSLAIFAG